jgi:2-polyprenyl-3-methyl-5-hydroxy-6-metoxy-1,4-benzoquinol methylase
MWQNSRSTELELLDLGFDHFTHKEYHDCLKLLARINWLLGGFRSTKKAIHRLPQKPKTILEIGCGGGYLCQELAKFLPESKIIGIDLSAEAINHSNQHLPEHYRNQISFEVQQEKALEYHDDSFDLVTTMLVCHHMTDEELIEFLKESYRICSEAVIINDLHRHFIAYASYSIIAPILFPNRLIWTDGRLSIRRAFKKFDWITLLQRAGFSENQYSLNWNFPFRWTLTIRKGSVE